MSLIICAFNESSTTVCSEDRAGIYDASGNFTVTREGLVKSSQLNPTIIFAATGLTGLVVRLFSIVQGYAEANFEQIAEAIPRIARELVSGKKEAQLVALLTGWDHKKECLRAVGFHYTNDFAAIEAPSTPHTIHLVFGPCADSQNMANDLLQRGMSLPVVFAKMADAYPQIGRGLTTRNIALLKRVETDEFEPVRLPIAVQDMECATVGSAAPSWALGGGAALTTANDFVHSGSKSLKITNPSGGANSISNQAISITGGLTYIVEGWVKTDAITNVSGHGAYLNVSAGSGVTGFTIITKFGAADGGFSSTPTLQIPASGAAVPYTFVQCYFVPNTSGFINLGLQLISTNAGSAWFDDVKIYRHNGLIYTGLTASTGYYLYPYIEASTGLIKATNGTPPSTSPSDTLALQCSLDGRVTIPPAHVTTPSSGGTGSGTVGGSGSCPEFDAPVFVRRYSEVGELLFEGQIKAGEVTLGFESEDGTLKRGDFLRGYSFTQQKEVYRAVQQASTVPCSGWQRLEGIRFTACEMVWETGQWMEAYKVPGAEFERYIGLKVLIQVEADWDDEHNFYVGTRLIHNALVLPC